MELTRKQKIIAYFIYSTLFASFTIIAVVFKSLKPAFGFASVYCFLMLINIIFTTLTNALIIRGENILPDGAIWRIILIIMTSIFFAIYCAL